MHNLNDIAERRTTTDVIYDHLLQAIVSLEMPPGTKLSEADIAKRFGISRQPVHDAFNKLESQGLLLIRPQKATTVRGFSMAEITHARFVRLAVELEVLRNACQNWQPDYTKQLETILAQQKIAIELGKIDDFHQLDYAFHRSICIFGNAPLAFDTIRDCKRKIDRLCVLSLGRDSEAATLLADHEDLAAALSAQDIEKACSIIRRHIGRLDGTIDAIHAQHAEYFETPAGLGAATGQKEIRRA